MPLPLLRIALNPHSRQPIGQPWYEMGTEWPHTLPIVHLEGLNSAADLSEQMRAHYAKDGVEVELGESAMAMLNTALSEDDVAEMVNGWTFRPSRDLEMLYKQKTPGRKGNTRIILPSLKIGGQKQGGGVFVELRWNAPAKGSKKAIEDHLRALPNSIQQTIMALALYTASGATRMKTYCEWTVRGATPPPPDSI
mgnify:CR=1 FL=1